MALNLWKNGGGLNSYNPLTSTLTNVKVDIGIGNFTIRFKAKSTNGAQIRIWTFNSGLGINQYTTLTNELKIYEYTFFNQTAQGLYFKENTTFNDVLLQDIELVQKPLPKLTINGIDGFLSGKWTLHANAQVVDDETLVLNATGLAQTSVLNIPILPNQTYTFKMDNFPTDGKVRIWNKDSSNASISIANDYTGGTVTFTTPSNAKFLDFNIYNNVATGQFTFKRPMLNLGSIAAPYSKKTDPNAKMVMPVPKKNMIPNHNFSSGLTGWTTSGVQVTSDNTKAILTANTTNVYMYKKFDVKTGQVLSVSADVETVGITGGTATFKVQWFNGVTFVSSVTVPSLTSTNPRTTIKCENLVVPSGVNIIHLECQINPSVTSGTMIAYQIQLEESTYATPYTPYAVQVNKKPAKYVPKKNLFDGVLEGGSIETAAGQNNSGSTSTRSANYLSVKPSNSYIISDTLGISDKRVFFYDISKNFISYVQLGSTFTTPSSAYYVRFRILSPDLTNKVQLEEGSTATAFENFQLVLPKAKTGLSFNTQNQTDYFQLPSMTLDSIEIDCLIDSVQPGNGYYIDARSGLANGYVRVGETSLQGWSSLKVNGQAITNPSTQVPKNQRIKLLFGSNSSFTDDVSIFNFNGTGLPADKTKGTLYKVTCYLNGNIVATYDFENAANQVGTTMMDGQAFNLIPSFDDSRWSLHANTQVLGKDYLRLNATATNQESVFTVPVSPNTKYLVTANTNAFFHVREFKDTTSLVNYWDKTSDFTFTTNSQTNKLQIYMTNGASKPTGTFDFIQPKLFVLDGKEGTLNGSPTRLNKASKRSLIPKR
jgi:hypothetical protein